MERRTGRGERQSLAERWSQNFMIRSEPTVVLCGEGELTAYGCRRIVLYTQPEIRLAMRRKTLCICGDRLICTSFSAGTVTVEGEIRAIRYLEKTEGNEAP